ncbi:glycosyltransferase family 4 protein [Rhizobium sp. CG5]|uniref:glycosyltransferase family 4 protein n=1 Tax=Rhizobium sp. CG5 TaxID=2726076 RepID=UPI002033C491|nr:glycosyltransferase family 4 protein [Rhizobium sp. CG5]MCM2473877.1 glycosyltransferase family 4 protein [Rhizobium sp. CG5]
MPETEPLRIIHCFRSPVGGIFRHVRDLAEQHSNAGHKVGIVCDSTTGGDHEDRLFDQIRPYLSLGLTRIPIRRSVGSGDARALWRSYKEIKSLQPDVLHGHGAKGGALARIIGSVLRVKKYRVARVYSPHGGSLHYDQASLAGRAIFSMERLLEQLTDAIVFVCDFERRTYETKVGVPRCSARMIYNGISDADIGAIPTRSDGVHFLYVGMLRDLKGPDVFIDAFARTERLVKHPLSALVVGDGPDRDKYDAMMMQRGLGRRIGLLPAMPVQDAFSMSNIVVVPSRAESMPYIVLEALGAAKSVIATRVGGIPEMLGADSEALVNPDDPDDLARVMAKAVTTPGWHDSTMPSMADFKARFSASVMADGILALYRERLTAIRSA